MSEAAVRREWVGSYADGRFPLLQWLGGSQASGVFLTELSEPSQKAVIKLILEDDEDAAPRAAAWETAATLSHPNLMKVYTHGRCEIDGVSCLYVVTEYADEVLADILKDRPLTAEETQQMLTPVLDSLRYLHRQGLVHGRLNPSNIMAAGDTLKLTTYGVCPVGAAVTFRPTRTVCDAPETKSGSILPASDLWSLGATLVEVLTQHPPQWDDLHAEPIVPATVPQPFATIARRCLRTDPARRSTIEALQGRIEPAKATPEPETKAAPPLPPKRRFQILFAIAAILLTAIGIWLSHRRASAPVDQTQTAPAAPAAPSIAPQPAPQPAPSAAPVPPPAEAATPPPAPAKTEVQPPPESQAQPEPQAASQPEPAPAASGQTINPAIVNQILPDIVPSALKTINGTLRVSVEVTVGADGKVMNATLASPGPSKYFASKSLEAARLWKFKASQENAPSSWMLEFQYRRDGIHVVAEPAAP
ncbi:MAG TPA: protein kinase [Terracidiphilus sp.]|nr:protein kinase [Terracidiphilus sp.]